MKKFRIYYYKTRNFITYKIIDAKNADEAIKKAKVKYIVEMKEIKAEMFAYDGCHKIYLLNNDEEMCQALECGYGIYDISLLKEKYENSCPLRFITDWTDLKPIVEQGEENVEFE